jgi:VCBS repeat-containing protein
VLLGGAGGGFGPATGLNAGGAPRAVAVDDFNDDNDPDLAVAVSDKVSVLLGAAGSSFGPATSFAAGDTPVSLAVGDFNGDTDPDLAVGNFNSVDVSVLLGGAGGSFGAASNYVTWDVPWSVAVGDFNGDADPDLAVARFFSGNISLLLNSRNRPPRAAADKYTTSEDTTLQVAAPGVLASDSDRDEDELNAVLESEPAHGTLKLKANGSFIYTPAPDFDGNDSFTYRASDGKLESDTATVTISVTAVNDAPSAAADTYKTSEDSPLQVAAPGVLAGDSDRDEDELSALLESEPAHGTLKLQANGSLTYIPAVDFDGNDSFTYRASDGKLESDTATVTISV